MIEDFTASGWVCVGITQQVDGPDLSISPEPLEKDPPAVDDGGAGGNI